MCELHAASHLPWTTNRLDVVAQCKKMDSSKWTKDTLTKKYGIASWPSLQPDKVSSGHLDMLDCEQIQVSIPVQCKSWLNKRTSCLLNLACGPATV